jgi:hypothetical protein
MRIGFSVHNGIFGLNVAISCVRDFPEDHLEAVCRSGRPLSGGEAAYSLFEVGRGQRTWTSDTLAMLGFNGQRGAARDALNKQVAS